MAPFYPRLPDPHYIDPLSTGVRGLGVGLQVGNQALQGELYGEALAEEREKRQALKEYGQTGDIGKLMSVSPEVGVKMQEVQARQQKAMMDAVKPGLELTYMLAPTATPDNYGMVRSSIVKSFPVMEGVLPKEYNKEQVDKFISQYETFLRKGKEERPYGSKWFQGPGGQFRTFAYGETPPPGWEPYEKPQTAREYPIVDPVTGKVTSKVTSTGRPIVDRLTKGKDYTAKQVDLDVKEAAEARKITNSYDKKIAGLTGGKETIRRETDRLLKERDAALADNKKTFANARGKLGGKTTTSAAGYDRSALIKEWEKRTGKKWTGGTAATTAAPTGYVSDEEDEDEEG